tara:strand:- start:895 stop:1011 length:117 start_codon:yes stop_codon:yes gene_type:complete
MINDINELIRELVALEEALTSVNPEEENVLEQLNKLEE